MFPRDKYSNDRNYIEHLVRDMIKNHPANAGIDDSIETQLNNGSDLTIDLNNIRVRVNDNRHDALKFEFDIPDPDDPEDDRVSLVWIELIVYLDKKKMHLSIEHRWLYHDTEINGLVCLIKLAHTAMKKINDYWGILALKL
jgi:hypothetical protein